MKAFRDNLALILVALIAIVLVFLMVRLQSLIMTTPEPTPASQATPEVIQPQQPAVVVQPTATTAAAVAPTNTPEPTQPPAPPTATTGGYTIYGAEVIGAIHVGAINDRGYNQAHHDGLQQMVAQVPGVRLVEAENIPETEAILPIIDQMVQQGAKIIFVQSFGYLPYAIQAAERYPDVVFLHPGGFELRDNLGTYWANNFEAMYLAGIAAGAATKTNQLGFITAFPIPNILASANAFHLGARSVNPTVTTKLVIDESWVDPGKENVATRALAASGVDVVTMIVDSPITVVQTAEALGIYVIGFHSDALQELAPNGWLTGVAYTWGNYYTTVVQQIHSGQWRAAHVRGGIESDMLRLANFGSAVSEETKSRITTARSDIINGKLAIFQGPLVDSQGVERISAGQIGGLELLDTTDWLVEGVSNFDVASVPANSLPVAQLQPLPTSTEPSAAAVEPTPTSATAASAPTATQSAAAATATTVPAPPTPTSDLVLGVTGEHPECRFFTNVVQQISQEKLGLTVEVKEFAEDTPMYEAIAERQDQRTIDMTLCFADPTDRPFLREYFGFVRSLGDIYWRNDEIRLQIMTNNGLLADLESNQVCLYRLLKNIHFEGNDLPSQDATRWIADNGALVDQWASCELIVAP